jgi:hypothetical protein
VGLEGANNDGSLVSRGAGLRWVLAVLLVWVLAVLLATAEPASVASRRWTVVNQDPNIELTLVSVTHLGDNPMDFEGRPPEGRRLLPRGTSNSSTASTTRPF